MEGSESEAAFDALNLNPQRFINEILNSIDDMLEGAFDFSLQQASEITGSGDPNSERSEELARGVSFLRQRTQEVLDKRMEMWEKYCLRHCFTVPEGFVLPNADSSSNGLLFQEGLADAELDSQLNILQNKLAVVGKKSVELQNEICSLQNQSTLSSSYHSYVAEAMQLLEQNSADRMFRELGETASKMQSKIEEVMIKRMGDNDNKRKHDLGLFASLEEIQVAANILRNA